jgi:hypothetical protein
VISRLIGAIARAFLVVLFIATPSLLLPGITDDAGQVVALVCIFGAAFTFVEYGSRYPSMVEFRFAAPFNRLRFASLFLTVFLIAVVFRGTQQPTALTEFITLIGRLVGEVIDFPISPVRLMLNALAPVLDSETFYVMKAAVGLSYVISLVMLMGFIAALNLNRWPSERQAFNVWVNLPLFEPSVRDDVVARLKRDALVNIMLGMFLPFIVPVVMRFATDSFDPNDIMTPQPLIWMVTLWAFLPASIVMRGVAMMRVAAMIHDLRRQRALAAMREWQPS